MTNARSIALAVVLVSWTLDVIACLKAVVSRIKLEVSRSCLSGTNFAREVHLLVPDLRIVGFGIECGSISGVPGELERNTTDAGAPLSSLKTRALIRRECLIQVETGSITREVKCREGNCRSRHVASCNAVVCAVGREGQGKVDRSNDADLVSKL